MGAKGAPASATPHAPAASPRTRVAAAAGIPKAVLSRQAGDGAGGGAPGSGGGSGLIFDSHLLSQTKEEAEAAQPAAHMASRGALGSGPRYQILSHVFARCASQ